MYQELTKILFPNSPFFGGFSHGIQGLPVRHVYMKAAVARLGLIDRPARILEVGSWIGSSALTWSEGIAESCPQKGTILCVDPWSSYITDDDVKKGGEYEIYGPMDFMAKSDLAYNLFRHNVRFAQPGVRVDHIRGHSHNILPYLQEKSFDITFIDGSHYYDECYNDLIEASRLVKDGGFICGDDLEIQIQHCDIDHAIENRRVDFIKDPKSGYLFHPGVTLAVGRFFGPITSYKGFWVVQKQGDSFRPVDLLDRPLPQPPLHFPQDLRKLISDTLLQDPDTPVHTTAAS